jgi:hypothetical protein
MGKRGYLPKYIFVVMVPCGPGSDKLAVGDRFFTSLKNSRFPSPYQNGTSALERFNTRG